MKGSGLMGIEEETAPSQLIRGSHAAPGSEENRLRSRRRASRSLVALALIGLGLSLIGSGFFADFQSLHISSPSPAGPGPGPTVRAVPRMVPSFYAVSSIPETVVSKGSSYTGASGTSAGDFLVVQIAYSEGSPGNLPDINRVDDTLSSAYARAASASPGVGANFWEQVWTGRASSTTTSTNVTVTIDWANCLGQCVSSVIISMTIARYRNVSGVGSMTGIAPNASSTSQSAIVSVAQAGSIIVEFLSHGAYDNCQLDAAQPGSGQTSRSCFTGTTERTELFDHLVSNARVYNESYAWSQMEVQRGIYLELDGGLVS
jgi:hypothetical protein